MKVSAALAAVLVVLHVGALALLFVVELPLWLAAALGLLLSASLYYSLVHHALRSAPQAILALRWQEEEGLSVTRRNSKSPASASIRSRFVHPVLVLLSLRLPGSLFPVSLVIAADALESDSFRRLRAALLAPPRKPAA